MKSHVADLVNDRPRWKARLRYAAGTVRLLGITWLLDLLPARWRSEYIHWRCPWDLEMPAVLDRNTLVLSLLRAHLPLAQARVLEVGCSRGVFTAELAAASGEVVAIDISSRACQDAAERVRERRNVSVRRMDIEREPLEGAFDVICAMDVLYFFRGRRALARVLDKLVHSLRPGGVLVVTDCRLGERYRTSWFQRHWPFAGDAYADLAAAHPELELTERRSHTAADPRYPEHLVALLRKASGDANAIVPREQAGSRTS